MWIVGRSKRLNRSGNITWSMSHAALIISFLALFCDINITSVIALPPGFRDEGVVSERQTVGFNFVPNIRSGSSRSRSSSQSEWLLLMTRKKGQIVAINNPDESERQSEITVILDIEEKVCTEGERGVFQVLPHPDFEENQYVYVFFTYDKNGGCRFSVDDGPVNAVARYRLVENASTKKLEMIDENIIFMSNPLPSKVHNGGDMKFGNDGYLYVTLGNGGMSNEHGNAQRANTLLGSIVRITDSGGIPPTNPFQEYSDRPCGQEGKIVLPDDGIGRCSEIFAIGFRNPFRFALKPTPPNATTIETIFHVNDVGGSFFEEVNVLNGETSRGLNYGYREREGPCKRNGDCTPQPELYVDPLYWYEHVDRTDACLTGGAFVPPGIWPNGYDGKYIIADFVFRKIFVLSEDDSAACPDCSPPLPGFLRNLFFDLADSGQPLQLTFGPYKDTLALYYSLWGPEEEFSVRRIIYEGSFSGDNIGAISIGVESSSDSIINSEGNIGGSSSGIGGSGSRLPVSDVSNYAVKPTEKNGDEDHKPHKDKSESKIEEEDTKEVEPLVENSAPDAQIRIDGAPVRKGQNYGVDEVIVFDASESKDPDGDSLTYSWNFGDGTGSTKEAQAHSFSEAGEYRVKLTVQDTTGSIDRTSRLITIGKLPEPSIVLPLTDENFAVGDVFTLYGNAVDGEGNYLKDSDLTWEVRQVHNTHYHPFLDPTAGNWIKIPPAPAPEDYEASTNSYLRIILTATDPNTNLSGSIIRDIKPNTKSLYFATDPAGLELTLDGFDVKTPEGKGIPLEVITWIHHNFTIDVKDQGGMVFESWSDGTNERYSREMIQERNPVFSSISSNNRDTSGTKVIRTARFVQLQEDADTYG